MGEYLKFLAALLAIVNPVGAVPSLLRLTAGEPPGNRRRIVLLASATVVAALLVTLAAGAPVLRFFGITVASLRVGGGILLLLMAVSMMQGLEEDRGGAGRAGPGTRGEHEEAAVIPVGMPLLAGPGAISTVIIYADRDPALAHQLALAAVILLVGALVWLSLSGAARISGIVGGIGLKVFNRIMGLVLAAVAVEFIANGVKQLFPALA